MQKSFPLQGLWSLAPWAGALLLEPAEWLCPRSLHSLCGSRKLWPSMRQWAAGGKQSQIQHTCTIHVRYQSSCKTMTTYLTVQAMARHCIGQIDFEQSTRPCNMEWITDSRMPSTSSLHTEAGGWLVLQLKLPPRCDESSLLLLQISSHSGCMLCSVIYDILAAELAYFHK